MSSHGSAFIKNEKKKSLRKCFNNMGSRGSKQQKQANNGSSNTSHQKGNKWTALYKTAALNATQELSLS